MYISKIVLHIYSSVNGGQYGQSTCSSNSNIGYTVVALNSGITSKSDSQVYSTIGSSLAIGSAVSGTNDPAKDITYLYDAKGTNTEFFVGMKGTSSLYKQIDFGVVRFVVYQESILPKIPATITNTYTLIKNTKYYSEGTEITSSGKLVVQEGSEIEFRNNSRLKVYGQLEVNGTTNAPAVFNFLDKYAIKTCIWVYNDPNSKIDIEAAEIKNSYRGIVVQYGDNHKITNCYIHNISLEGLHIQGSTNFNIDNNTITACTKGIYACGNQTIKLQSDGLNKIDDYNTYALEIHGGTAYLGEYHHKGKNSFIHIPGKIIIYTNAVEDVLAEKNYWGGSPQSSWFDGSGYVEWSFPLSSPAGGVGSTLGKVHIPELTPDRRLFEEAMELTDSKEHNVASEKFKQLVADFPNSQFASLSVAWAMSSSKVENEFTKQSSYLESIRNHANKKVRDIAILWLLTLESETGNKEDASKLVSTVPIEENVGIEIRLNWANDLLNLYNDEEGADEIFEEILNANPNKNTIEVIEVMKEMVDNSSKNKLYKFKKKELEESPKLENQNLLEAFPNPFNPTTQIVYKILSNSFVTLKVFNMLGEELANLVNSIKSIGQYSVPFSAEHLPSGIYIYKIETKDYSKSKKLILLK